MNTPAIRYSATKDGVSYAHVTGATTHVIRVAQSRMPNATARGGAYYDAYTATARGHKFTERTRKAAVARAIDSLRSRGFDI